MINFLFCRYFTLWIYWLFIKIIFWSDVNLNYGVQKYLRHCHSNDLEVSNYPNLSFKSLYNIWWGIKPICHKVMSLLALYLLIIFTTIKLLLTLCIDICNFILSLFLIAKIQLSKIFFCFILSLFNKFLCSLL